MHAQEQDTGNSALLRAPATAAVSARGRGILVLIVALLWLFARSSASAAPAAGEVVAIDGRCYAEAGGQPIALGMAAVVHVGDTVHVPAGAKLKLRMNDGSIVSIASGSALTISNYALGAAGRRQNAVLWLGSGLLRAVVSAGTWASFEVDTAVGTAAVRSTDWFVSAVSGAMQVGVLRGSVVLASSATGRSVTIPARWGARLEAGHDPVPPRLWRPAEFDNVIARTTVN